MSAHLKEIKTLKDKASADRAAHLEEVKDLKAKASADGAAFEQEIEAVRNQLANVQAPTVVRVLFL